MAATLAGGCLSPEPPPSRLDVSVPNTDGALELATLVRFADDLQISKVRVIPKNATPGASVTVRFEVEHGAGPAMVSWEPPRAASRQVALGGPEGPPATVPPDPRTQSVNVALHPGSNEVQVVVPDPWHPRRAVLTLTRAEGASMGASQGPRTEAGRAILAVVDVNTRPTKVVAVRGTPELDGRLADEVWARAEFTELVESLEGEPVPEPATRIALAWDDQALYCGAHVLDDDVWSEYQRHDDPLWKQEVFELFVFGDAGRSDYLELQVSPRGIRFDARFETYRNGDEDWNGAWRAAVKLDGTLERRDDVDRGWSVELAVPWAEICENTQVQCPPNPGDTLRINVFRLERPARGQAEGMALSPTRVPDFHAASNAAVLQLGGSRGAK